jgi:uncharacterized protein YuzE
LEEEGLKVDYDSDGDVLYFHFKDGPAESVREIEDDVVVELDKRGGVMGIEVWGARRDRVLKQLVQMSLLGTRDNR